MPLLSIISDITLHYRIETELPSNRKNPMKTEKRLNSIRIQPLNCITRQILKPHNNAGTVREGMQNILDLGEILHGFDGSLGVADIEISFVQSHIDFVRNSFGCRSHF